jgi:hypothetical protein
MSAPDVLGVLVLFAIVAVAVGVARWLNTRADGPDEPCSVCGVTTSGKRRHVVAQVWDDGTAMSATFCPRHCPGNCGRNHVRV